jgi:hypothetical protein
MSAENARLLYKVVNKADGTLDATGTTMLRP